MKEAELAMMRRLGAPEDNMLIVQGNLANTYRMLGRLEEALQMKRDVYSGWLKLNGEEHEETLMQAYNYANVPYRTTALRRNQVAAAQNNACGATRPR